MGNKVTIIAMRWWGHLVLLLCIPVVGALAAAMGWSGVDALAEPGGWWKGALLSLFLGLMLFVALILLNLLFTYRLEIDAGGLRLVGNFWTHHVTWREITNITRRPNPRGLGFHVHLEVDGSNLPRRHWSGLWFAGYQIPTPMEKAPAELTAFLKRKQREYLNRQQADAGAE